LYLPLDKETSQKRRAVTLGARPGSEVNQISKEEFNLMGFIPRRGLQSFVRGN